MESSKVGGAVMVQNTRLYQLTGLLYLESVDSTYRQVLAILGIVVHGGKVEMEDLSSQQCGVTQTALTIQENHLGAGVEVISKAGDARESIVSYEESSSWPKQASKQTGR